MIHFDLGKEEDLGGSFLALEVQRYGLSYVLDEFIERLPLRKDILSPSSWAPELIVLVYLDFEQHLFTPPLGPITIFPQLMNRATHWREEEGRRHDETLA